MNMTFTELIIVLISVFLFMIITGAYSQAQEVEIIIEGEGGTTEIYCTEPNGDSTYCYKG